MFKYAYIIWAYLWIGIMNKLAFSCEYKIYKLQYEII